MTIMSKNSVFRNICNFEALLYKVDFISDNLKCRAAQVQCDLPGSKEFGHLRGFVLLV